jgi:hypothetical protein
MLDTQLFTNETIHPHKDDDVTKTSAELQPHMGKTRAIIASYVGVLIYAGFVFLGAWKIAYWQALLYVVLALVGTTLSHILVPAGSTITANRAREARAGGTGISGCSGRSSWSMS